MATISESQQSELISAIDQNKGFKYERFTSAAGIEGNFKVFLAEALERDHHLMQRFAGLMTAELTEVDVIVATGGAVRIANEIAKLTDMPLVEFVPYNLGQKKPMLTKNATGDDILRAKPRVGIVEDVTSTRDTVEHLANRYSMQGLVDLIVTGWRRGITPPNGMTESEVTQHNRKFNFRNTLELPSDIPIVPIIERRVPLWIPLSSQISVYLPELSAEEIPTLQEAER